MLLRRARGLSGTLANGTASLVGDVRGRWVPPMAAPERTSVGPERRSVVSISAEAMTRGGCSDTSGTFEVENHAPGGTALSVPAHV